MNKQLSDEEIIHLVKQSDVKSIRYAVTDIDGVLRGKLISKEKFISALQSGINFCNVIFGWDINDECYTNTKISGWHTGYPDEKSYLDLASFRTIPWENDQPFFMGDFRNSNNLKEVCPRSLLHSITKQANDLGYKPNFSNEFEWFNFRETPQSLFEKNYADPTPLTPGMFGYSILRISQSSDFVHALFNQLSEFNIPLEGLHTETGNGVYEAAIKYTDINEAADQATLFKTAVKEIAYRFEILPSFMAKWNLNLPGCSGHIHQSLWNSNNENVFFDSQAPHNLSKLAQHYLAGQLHCLPFILPIFAPNTNSYKRFAGGDWAPRTTSWGVENRTTAFRVINDSKEAMRIEHRVPGADANPYLTMAASLASGLYGINNELELPEPVLGNAYNTERTTFFPTTLEDAIDKMKKSDIAKQLFGETFTDHFIRTREWESKCRNEHLDEENWELKRYFEIV